MAEKKYDVLMGYNVGDANDMECGLKRSEVGRVVEDALKVYTHITITPHEEEE